MIIFLLKRNDGAIGSDVTGADLRLGIIPDEPTDGICEPRSADGTTRAHPRWFQVTGSGL